MKMRRAILCVLVALAVAGAGDAQRKRAKRLTPPQEAVRAEETRIAAVVMGDVPALERILADGLNYTHSDARSQTKAEFINSIKAGELAYLSMQHRDVLARVYGDAAVVTGKSTVRVQSPRGQGEIRQLEICFISVFAKQQGRWRQVAWQSTRIPPKQ